MYYVTQRVDVTHQRTYRDVQFRIAQASAQILECFYAKLNPRFPIAPADMGVTGGATMGDVVLRIRLFAGLGLVEISGLQFVARFERLTNETDIKVVKDCLLLCDDALRESFPTVQIREETIRTASWLKCQAEQASVLCFLEDHMNPTLKDLPKTIGGSRQIPSIRTTVLSPEEMWEAVLLVDRSVVPNWDLFYLCEIAYREEGLYKSLVQKAEHFEHVYRQFLKHVGLKELDQQVVG